MAEFVTASLTHSRSGNRVLFRVDARIKFDPHEQGTHWFLAMTFMEDDTFADDNLGTHRRTFFANSNEVDVSFGVSMKKSKVDTELWKEEVFAMLEVVPLEEPPPPPPFRIGRATTNTTNVSV